MQHRRPATTASTTEVSIDLTAQELLEPAPAGGSAEPEMIEVSDIGEVDPALRTGSFAANSTAAPDGSDDLVEIELTAEQMENLLGEA